MPSRVLDFPVFDADNHMYEKPEALTKYLPKEYEGFIKYVQVNGRTKIAVNNKISDYIPNPTFESWRPPAHRRSTSRSAIPRASPAGRPWARASGPIPATETRAAYQAPGRAGDRPCPHLAHPGQPVGGAGARQPPCRACCRPLAQPMDGGALDLQLREPDVHDARHPLRDRRRGDSRA